MEVGVVCQAHRSEAISGSNGLQVILAQKANESNQALPELTLFYAVRVTAECDRPDWASPHNAPACAGTSSADPDVSPGSTNRVVRRPHQWEPGHLNGQASVLERRKAIEREEDESKTTEETAE
ncbi:hypothetical protein NDU88_002398 [Pleurodeles waltl]|uniref:Uncharacterized protein n=1 Tax=Pleurodeles waltl TaxID=8319 RepID=A0AAV7Q8N9_PLEWA|nr:hypothetical protein NDU88_002398 [Pleurodeles waltl]